MKTKFIEATQGVEHGPNWGKFAVCQFDTNDWRVPSGIGIGSLIAACGWNSEHRLVLDLQTGEGAIFKPGGLAKADLDRHKVWVCVLFQPFLEWLYTQPLPLDLDTLPDLVELPHAPAGLHGYRRSGQ